MDKQQKTDRKTTERQIKQQMRSDRGYRPAGYYSNAIITARNGGVQPRFIDDIGGCSANYR